MKFSTIIAIVIAATVGWLAARMSHHDVGKESQRKVLYYQSPMHPWVKADKPGQCTVCGMDLVPVYQGDMGFDHKADKLVMLPQGSPNVMGVKTVEINRYPLLRTLKVSGTIGEDESRHGVISAPVEGRIDGLSTNHPGQQVTRRQPLATIFSKTLLAAANDYKTALPQGGPAVETAKRRLEQYGLVWEQIKAIPDRQPDDLYFGVLSPATGVIVKSYVHEGQYVKEGEKLFETADFTTMWFVFTAYEQDLPFLKPRQVVKVSIPSLGGETINARLGAITPILDEESHSAMVRVVLENPERRFFSNSTATAVIDLEATNVLAVPRSAVLWSGTTARVYVEKDTGVYEQRAVKLGRSGDADWEMLNGLKQGERVVVSGNVLIDGQAQLNNLGAASKP